MLERVDSADETGACCLLAGTSGNTAKLKRLGLAADCNMADKVAEEYKVGRFFQPFKNCFYRLRYLYRTWKLFVSCIISGVHW